MPRLAEGAWGTIRINRDDLHEILGAARFKSEIAMLTSAPGVATGLAGTPVGGDILLLGEMMRESAQAARISIRPVSRQSSNG